MKNYELILKAISYARDGQKLPDNEANAATAALARIYAQQSMHQTKSRWAHFLDKLSAAFRR